MAREKMTSSLQENIITMLAFNEPSGKIVAQLVTADLFEGEYRTIAERCLEYWVTYRMPPGDHVSDLFSDILEDPKNRMAKPYRNILTQMHALSTGLNTKYVLDQVTRFIRLQDLKDGILRSAEQLQAHEDMAIEEVEELWHKLLASQRATFDPGVRLDDFVGVLNYMAQLRSEFAFGIAALDKRNIVPYRGSVTLLIGPRGAGKSWFLVHTGRTNLMRGKKVLHITLEMAEYEVAQRYYQSLFSVTTHQVSVKVPTFEMAREGSLILSGISLEDVEPEFSFDSQFIRDELATHVNLLGRRARNLIIKSFPTSSLTMRGLEAYLDMLETNEGFVPDLILLDYIGLVKTSAANKRLDLSQAAIDFRGLVGRRSMAGVTAQQAGRGASASGNVQDSDVAEDFSLTHTADQVMAFSRTAGEKSLGLGRIHVSKARGVRDSWTAVVGQNFGIGQFAITSALATDEYDRILKELSEEEGENIEEDGDEEEYDDGL